MPGFEYWANPSKPEEGFITWQTDGQPSVRMGASAVGADQGADGSGVSKRLIPEEPMVRLSFSVHTTVRLILICFIPVDYPELGYFK